DSKSEEGRVISVSQPFAKKNKYVLLPILVQGNHWCGAVFELTATPTTITVFDPMQTQPDRRM
ncbi:hypothetical protein JG688_00011358, partial [Phytophthora aleatoria]